VLVAVDASGQPIPVAPDGPPVVAPPDFS
jgi:hypothetical protein